MLDCGCPHPAPHRGEEVLHRTVIRGSVGAEYRPIHLRMLKAPMPAAGLRHDEAQALKLAPVLLHFTGQFSILRWHTASGAQPGSAAARLTKARGAKESVPLRIPFSVTGCPRRYRRRRQPF